MVGVLVWVVWVSLLFVTWLVGWVGGWLIGCLVACGVVACGVVDGSVLHCLLLEQTCVG